MSADGPVLDLDVPHAGEPAERVPLWQVELPLWVVAVVVFVVAVTAVWGTRAADDERTRREQSAVVRLIVSVPPDTDLAGGGDFLSSTFTGALTVVNAGPLPVRITDVSSATNGFRINPVGGQPSAAVPAGESSTFSVGVGVVCRAWGNTMPISLVMSLTTADGRRVVQQRPLDLGSWSDTLQSNCPPAF